MKLFTICLMLLLVVSMPLFAKIDPKTVEGLWLFDEGSGSVAKDYSGKGLNGAIKGTPNWVAGKFGKALQFDGKTNFVEIPAHKNPTTAVTLSAWVKSAAATWNQHGWIFEKRDAYIIHPNGNSTNVAFCVVNGAPWNQPKSWDTGAVGPKDITVWHMYTCTFDSTTGKWAIYIDGEEASSMEINKAKIAEDAGPAHIGWDEAEAQRFGNATIDEVAVFNVALAKADIQEMMKNGLGVTLTAVDTTGKVSTKWADIKTQY